MKDTNASMEEKSKEITNKSEEKAEKEVDKTAAEEDHTSAGLKIRITSSSLFHTSTFGPCSTVSMPIFESK